MTFQLQQIEREILQELLKYFVKPVLMVRRPASLGNFPDPSIGAGLISFPVFRLGLSALWPLNDRRGVFYVKSTRI